MPFVAERLVGKARLAARRQKAEVRRVRQGRPHQVTFYHCPADPHSLLLNAALDRFEQLYPVSLTRRLVSLPAPPYVADTVRYPRWSALDAGAIAPWFGLSVAALGAEPSGADDQRAVLQSKGHYDTALLHYEGEWYRGINRLALLEDRLASLGVGSGHAAPRQTVPAGKAPAGTRIRVWLSIRSPYSYLAFARTLALAAELEAELIISPVLPMVMRGLKVPRKKRFRILYDAAREAHRQNIPFGRVCDPLGPGVERALAVFFSLAEPQGRGAAFLEAAMSGAWSRGVDLASDRGLAQTATAAELDPQQALAAAKDHGWRAHVADNREALLATGMWGVPTFEVSTGGVTRVCWGQDRLWLVRAWALGLEGPTGDGAPR